MTGTKETIMSYESKKLQLKINGFDLFGCRSQGDLINPLYAYYGYFGEIPSVKHFWLYIDFEASVKWLEDAYKDKILKKHTAQLYGKSDYEVMNQVNYYAIKDRMILTLQTNGGSDLFFSSDDELSANVIIENLKKFVIKDKENISNVSYQMELQNKD